MGNDGCGKGLSGGRVIVRPNPTQLEGGHFVPSENVIVGNVACYGATAGEAFFRGVGGERFCVRNSGEDADELRGYIEKHVAATESSVGADLLADWDNSVSKFIRVMPTDYKAVLEKMKAE